MMKFQKILGGVLLGTLVLGMLLMGVSCSRKHDDPVTPVDPTQSESGSSEDVIPGWSLVIKDSLLNTTQDTIEPYSRTLSGGAFTPNGYEVNQEYYGYILYQTDIVRDILVTFDAVGYESREWYINDNDEFTIIMLVDSPPGTDWNTAWRTLPYWWFRMFKMGNYPGGANSYDGLKIKAGSCYHLPNTKFCGEESKSWNSGMYPGFIGGPKYSWDENTVYHWKFMIDDGDLYVWRNDELVYERWSAFRPGNPYNVYIGGSDMRHLSPDNITYSNVKIYRKQQ